jgi:RNA polymerase sigma-70 factor (ECF subfamily)
MNGLVELLAADVAVYGDGGGNVPSWPRPIFGRDRVARLLASIGRQARELGLKIRRAEINASPA